jgi:hypothetical protein
MNNIEIVPNWLIGGRFGETCDLEEQTIRFYIFVTPNLPVTE